MTHHKYEGSNISIIDAVEALSGIADLDMRLEGQSVSRPIIELEGQTIESRNVDWIQNENIQSTIERVKEIFHVVLSYLRYCYRKESSDIKNPQTIEGIKTIMVLVGEAAKKLDKYTGIIDGKLNHSFTQLPEYRHLQEFFQKKINRKVDENLLSKWILGLTSSSLLAKQKEAITDPESWLSSEHVYVDLDSLKNDREYELLLIRKEDGSRFYNPRLIRNMKLVCDFGGSFQTTLPNDPLANVSEWNDRVCQIAAHDIIKSLGVLVNDFYRISMHYKDYELVENLHKALMALMLAADQRHLRTYSPSKSCESYFTDFQLFLREALHCREYQKSLVYSSKDEEELPQVLVNLAHALCRALFINLKGIQALLLDIDRIVHKIRSENPDRIEGMETNLLLWSRLAYDYAAFLKMFKQHPNGPLMKMLSVIETGDILSFDSLMQGNLPNSWFDLHMVDHTVTHIRLPSPTRQTMINKAFISDEFRGFLFSQARADPPLCHLLINFQDRTSWREGSRCHALESIQQNPSFAKSCMVVTLPIETEFYNQNGKYRHMHDVNSFCRSFKQQFFDENSGFFFSEDIRHLLDEEFIDKAFHSIHKGFFDERSKLSRENRLDFITLFYLVLHMKLLETVRPYSFSFTCKDGIDMGESFSALFFAFYKLMHSEVISEADLEYLNLILYAPAILLRERCVLAEPFNRFLCALKVVETIRQKRGFSEFVRHMEESIGAIFNSSIIKAKITIPTALQENQWILAA